MTREQSPEEGADPVAELRRWEEFGAVWRVVASGPEGMTVSMCTCDGGEEVARLTSAEPALREYVGGRTTSQDDASG